MTELFPKAGELFALLTALCWTVTAISFEYAGKKVGSLPVNILRLLIALVFFSIHGLVFRGLAFPLDASVFAWKWLGLSALVGFCIGDLLLFRAFVIMGSRLSMLIMSAVPPITALTGWLVMGETLTPQSWVGMGLTMSGIIMVLMLKSSESAQTGSSNNSHSSIAKGLLYATGGAVGQALGLVLSKYGMRDFDAFAATHIRVLVGAAGFALMFTFSGSWRNVIAAVKNSKAMNGILLGSLFGPFLGVSFSLLAIQYTDTGIASTIMSIVPVMIIAPAIILFKEKISWGEVAGSCIAVIGVGILFF